MSEERAMIIVAILCIILGILVSVSNRVGEILEILKHV